MADAQHCNASAKSLQHQPEISRRAQLISVCLVWGSRQATTPPASSSADTSRMGTAQVLSTRLPKTMFPMMAATRPTPVKKPRAEDLKGARQTAEEQWLRLGAHHVQGVPADHGHPAEEAGQDQAACLGLDHPETTEQ
ncbi:hypothetical protein CRUP_034464 [Coryphaenoides rupestris]|nr:hypothetical protein CRUP_034464 [Coryphaenoides rupestris]